MNKKDAFLIYYEYEKYFAALSPEDGYKLLMAIFAYEKRHEETIKLDGMAAAFFMVMKDALDRNSDKWSETTGSRSEAGKKGMEARWHGDNTDNNTATDGSTGNKGITDDNKNNTVITDITGDNKNNKTMDGITNITVPVPVPVHVPDSVPVNVTESAQARTDALHPTPPDPDDPPLSRKKFIKPTLQQVKDYCLSRHNTVDPQAWLDHYESNGWKIGARSPMEDWQAAVRTWEHNNYSLPKSPPKFQGMDGDRQQHDKAEQIMQQIIARSTGGLQQ
jgi:hypothetical protein